MARAENAKQIPEIKAQKPSRRNGNQKLKGKDFPFPIVQPKVNPAESGPRARNRAPAPIIKPFEAPNKREFTILFYSKFCESRKYPTEIPSKECKVKIQVHSNQDTSNK